MQSQILALPILLSFNEDQRVAIAIGTLYFLIYVPTSFAARNPPVVCSDEQASWSLQRISPIL